MIVDFRKLDWPIVLILVFFAVASLIVLLGLNQRFFWQQLLWFAASFAVVVILSQPDWRWFSNHRFLHFSIYAFGILLLLAILAVAQPIRGVKSWLVLGPFQFQPAEFMKLALITVYAGFFARRHVEIARVRNIFISFAYLAVPAFLVVLQPDLGTALIFFGIWLGFLLVSGISWRHLLAASAVFVIVGIFAWGSFLENYQKERIISLFFPERDPLGSSYNVIQSKIAIGSAGFLGKGFGQGTQTQLGFLPEAHNDFIFAAFVEEWGLLGGALLISAFLFLILRIVKIGLRSDSNFFAFFCLGTAIAFLLQFTLNIGSNLGLVPVVGVSFPFLSYGGSNLLISAVLVGIIQQISGRAR